MTNEMFATLSLAVGAVLIVAMLCAAGLAAWRGWLKLKRLEMEAARKADALEAGEEADAGRLIELAAVKERLRRLEAIANGVEL